MILNQSNIQGFVPIIHETIKLSKQKNSGKLSTEKISRILTQIKVRTFSS